MLPQPDVSPEPDGDTFDLRASNNNWGRHNALRRYLSVVSGGQTHPFKAAGGALIDFAEGPQAIKHALDRATVERVPLSSLIATNPVNTEHVGKLLRGQVLPARTGSAFESQEMPTVVRVKDGQYHLIKDGHHRCTDAWCKGETHAKMRVVSGLTPRFQNHAGLLLQP